jgi:hypothetical protein
MTEAQLDKQVDSEVVLEALGVFFVWSFLYQRMPE